MKKALFLDRDGVLDALVFRKGDWGAPLQPAQLEVLPGVRQALELASQNGWMIFVVSNQPDAAKENATEESLQAVHARLLEELRGAPITEFFYCFHRAEDRCACRKPEPFFVLDAAKRHDIDLGQSWFVGDTGTDIDCGQRAGCRTALIEYPYSNSRRGTQRPDWVCRNLGHFVNALLGRESPYGPQPQD